MKLVDALAHCPVVAIVRGVRPEEAVEHAEALFRAGVRAIEVPLNSPDPLESIRRIVDTFQGRLAIGGGTVLTPDRVDAVAEAGGRLIVSPNTAPDVIRRAVGRGMDPAPGFASATEAFMAYDAGARHLKLFPAVTYGPAHLRQLTAVLPADATVWAVGGVGPENMPAWWAAGARAFGVGGELYRAGQSVHETGDKARQVVAAAQKLH